MAFKRRSEPTAIEDERAALREQHAALEDLKRQLTERVDSVRERELELHHALAEAGGSRQEHAVPSPRLPPAPAHADAEADTGEDAIEAERRELALLERERAVAEREMLLSEQERQLEVRSARELEPLAERESRLERLDEEPAAATPPTARGPEADAMRLAQIEARLAELRDAEKLFLRTRDELAARSEAVASRERLAAQKERELDDRDDEKGQWAPKELSEMEARLHRLEQQRPGEQTIGFSGGLRKLGEGTRSHRGT